MTSLPTITPQWLAGFWAAEGSMMIDLRGLPTASLKVRSDDHLVIHAIDQAIPGGRINLEMPAGNGGHPATRLQWRGKNARDLAALLMAYEPGWKKGAEAAIFHEAVWATSSENREAGRRAALRAEKDRPRNSTIPEQHTNDFWAGFFDGDGCVEVGSGGWAMSLGQAGNPSLVLGLQAKYGGTVRPKLVRGNRKPQMRWYSLKGGAIEMLASSLLPYGAAVKALEYDYAYQALSNGVPNMEAGVELSRMRVYRPPMPGTCPDDGPQCHEILAKKGWLYA